MTVGEQAETFERCMSVGGIAVFPADTVYGLACDAGNTGDVIRRLYALKRRPLSKPSAVMFFDLETALTVLPELGERTRAALAQLLPGKLTVLVPNPERRFPLACGEDPTTLGLRVVSVPALAGVRWPVLQSSANLAGGPEARTLAEVPEPLRAEADMVIDGGELPGTASTVVDLRGYEHDGSWSIVRRGRGVRARHRRGAARPVPLRRRRPTTRRSQAEIPVYDELQEQLELASGDGAATDPGTRHRNGGDGAAAAGPPSRRDARRGRRVRRDAGGGRLRGCPPTGSRWSSSRLEHAAARRADSTWWRARWRSTTWRRPRSVACSDGSARRCRRAGGSCWPT